MSTMTFKTNPNQTMSLTRRQQEQDKVPSRSTSQKGQQPRRGSGSSLECLDIYRTLVASVHGRGGNVLSAGSQRRCEEAECLSYFSTEALESALRARKTTPGSRPSTPEIVERKHHGDSAPWYSSPAWYR